MGSQWNPAKVGMVIADAKAALDCVKGDHAIPLSIREALSATDYSLAQAEERVFTEQGLTKEGLPVAK